MSKKGTIEVFQTKISRNDRFAQMSHQEKLIEQKKREIQAKLEQQRQKAATAAAEHKNNNNHSANMPTKPTSVKSPIGNKTVDKKPFNFNTFSNDGSFLNQFKQMKEKKMEQQTPPPSQQKKFKPREDRFNNSDERNKNSKWKNNKDMRNVNNNKRQSRFSDGKPQININTTYSNLLTQQQVQQVQNQNYEPIITAQEVTGQPLLKNLVPIPLSPQNTQPVVAAPPLLLNVPPPQIQLLPEIPVGVDCVIATVTLPSQGEGGLIAVPPPNCIELANIPPPNPIQVHNIPQPEPINTLTIPPPAPLQVQNIPPPSPIQLNEIPNPKPLDLLAIPTPNDGSDKITSDPEFIKNVPPPNKSIPPPNIADINVPPPPPPQTTQTQSLVLLNNQSLLSLIPPLMAQPILPPPGMVPMNIPPPILQPPPNFINTAQIISVPPPNIKDLNTVFPPGSADYEAMASLGRMVAQCGPGIEDIVRQRKNQDPSLWFLFHKESGAYLQYQQLIEQFKLEFGNAKMGVDSMGNACNQRSMNDYKPEDIYEPEAALEEEEQKMQRNARKRKSRWGDKDDNVAPPGVVLPTTSNAQMNVNNPNLLLSKITRSDPGLLQYVLKTYGSTNITDEDWKKAEENYKINILYQDMLRKRHEVERLQNAGRNKYDYDSDEDVDGGTWEHKLREKEMHSTQVWSNELNRQAEGKHHIGDFLPPEEFKKFMERTQALKEGRPMADNSDYKEFKLCEDNVGFKMLQKLGWSEGKGLGSDGKGILEPINKGTIRESNQGLGLDATENLDTNDDEYDAYRKRMMLAYRFRPNPLNNPRRPYY